MTLYREISWWYWGVSAALLTAGLAGQFGAFYLVLLLSTVQVIHFRLREGAFKVFPVQVRLTYTAILLLAFWHPMRWMFWLAAVGRTAQVLFGYCPLARTLSLMPWNRNAPFSWRLIWRTFLSRPVRGNVLQGLPASP